MTQKVPSSNTEFLDGCATIWYISVTRLTKPVSFLQNPEKPSFCTYFYIVTLFIVPTDPFSSAFKILPDY